MKPTKEYHNERVQAIKVQLGTLICQCDGYHRGWIDNLSYDKEYSSKCYEAFRAGEDMMESLKSELKFHEVMLQDKGYATRWLWSDAQAYEIIEERTDKMILVRRLKATIKPEAQKALSDSFVPGGFYGHFENDLQKWDFESDASQPIETIRKHKNGRWYGSDKMRFTIEAEPYERYDYNF